MHINTLVNLTSRAWSLDILAAMDQGAIGRQADLIAATGAGRPALAQSLEHLVEMGLVERNPGHGHPLRPEFRLTAQGKQAAQMAREAKNTIAPKEEWPIIRRSWTVPILLTAQQPIPFGGIKESLGTISDRALSQSLKILEDKKWLKREILLDIRPPKPIYSTINTGSALAKAIEPFMHQPLSSNHPRI